VFPAQRAHAHHLRTRAASELAACVLRSSLAPAWCCQPQVPEIDALREDVEAFAKQFPTIGFDKASMRYKD
jgi:hypothetical protein